MRRSCAQLCAAKKWLLVAGLVNMFIMGWLILSTPNYQAGKPLKSAGGIDSRHVMLVRESSTTKSHDSVNAFAAPQTDEEADAIAVDLVKRQAAAYPELYRDAGALYPSAVFSASANHLPLHNETDRPVVYTYFSPNERRSPQDEWRLIELWKQSWELRGWHPLVLNESDARAHPLYDILAPRLWKLANFTVNARRYEYACYIRWLAVAARGGGVMADYDVMSYSFRPRDVQPLDKLGFYMLDRRGIYASNPGIVSGSAAAFLHSATYFAGYVLVPGDVYRGKPHMCDMTLLNRYFLNVPGSKFQVPNPERHYMDAKQGKLDVYSIRDWFSTKAVHFASSFTPGPRYKHINRLRPIQGMLLPFLPYGPGNQRFALFHAMLVSKMLGRALVLPKLRAHYTTKTKPLFSDMGSFFNVSRMNEWVETVPRETFDSMCNGKISLLIGKENRKGLPSANIPSFGGGTFDFYGDVVSVERLVPLSNSLTMSDIHTMLQKPHLLHNQSAYGNCIGLDIGFRALQPTEEEQRMVLSHNVYVPKFDEIATKWIQHALKLPSDTDSSWPVLTLHLRRGDWSWLCSSLKGALISNFYRPWYAKTNDRIGQSRHCYPTIDEVVSMVKRYINSSSIQAIVVCTNVKNDTEVRQLTNNFNPLPVLRFEHDTSLTPSEISIVEQRIAVHSAAFIGNVFSTWSIAVADERVLLSDKPKESTAFWGLIPA